MENSNQMVVTDDFGQEHILEIVLTFDNESGDRHFVLFTDPSDPDSDDVYAYEYDDEGNMNEVTSEEDLEMCAEVLGAFQDEEL